MKNKDIDNGKNIGNRYFKKMRFTFYILFISLWFNGLLFSQEKIILNDSLLPNTKGLERNALTLVNKLIEGKTDEKDKFDVIFTWVAKNIKYDYSAYLSPKGTSLPRIDRILKYKAGICLDNAYLMDTLCNIANIKCVAVTGYAKDDLFDVNDSIYADNHAWNAVRLNSKWYLFDVTWTSGKYKRKLTSFSKLIYDKQEKIKKQTITKELIFKTVTKTECDTIKTEFKQPQITTSFKNKIILKFLSLFKLKSRLYFDRIKYPYYYLSEPSVFAITHFPDDPRWALTSDYISIKDFEGDSAYYYLNDSIYMQQKREGAVCTECNSFIQLSEMQKEKQIIHNSSNFNPKGFFATWVSNHNIATIFFQESIPVTDSTTKVGLLDSALTYLAQAKNDLRKSLVSVGKENHLQKIKNNRKYKLLKAENKIHLNAIKGIQATTSNSTKGMARLNLKSKSETKQLHTVSDRLNELPKIRNKNRTKFKQKENSHRLELQCKYGLNKIDSINRIINSLRIIYPDSLIVLSKNIWNKNKLQDSLAFKFLKGSNYRQFYLEDNYKKLIVDERENIKDLMKAYKTNMYENIYKPSYICANIGSRIFDLVNERNKTVLATGKLLSVLVSEDLVKRDSLDNFVRFNENKIHEDICWIVGGSSKLKSVIAGYRYLLISQKKLEACVKNENRSEYKRYRVINLEILRRKIKLRNICSHNLKVCSTAKSLISQNKREFLKQYKKKSKRKKLTFWQRLKAKFIN